MKFIYVILIYFIILCSSFQAQQSDCENLKSGSWWNDSALKKKGRLSHLKSMINLGCDLSGALYYASTPEAVELLIKGGARVNERLKKFSSETPLHYNFTSPLVTQALLDAGARVNARNKYGFTPLHSVVAQWHSLQEKSVSIATVLIRAGADVNARLDKELNRSSPVLFLATA